MHYDTASHGDIKSLINNIEAGKMLKLRHINETWQSSKLKLLHKDNVTMLRGWSVRLHAVSCRGYADSNTDYQRL